MTHSVLLVEDEPRSLKLITAIFDGAGYKTFGAADGAIALQILEREHIDLVITDMLMPNVDGYYLCYKIRNNPKLKEIPIIVYTATLTSVNEDEIAGQMGANIFLRKPAPTQVLLNAAKSLTTGSKKNPVPVTSSGDAFEVMHQYNSELVRKLEQRNYELEEIRQTLEMKVQERTEELQTINEELSSTNDQLHERNEELLALNDKLQKAARIIQEQSETILKQKDEQLNRVLDSSLDVIWSFDLTGNGQNYLSRSVVNVYHEDYDKLINEPYFWLKYVHPEDSTLKDDSQKRLGDTGETECTYRIITNKGVRWVRDHLKLIRDVHGKALRVEGIVADVTDLKQAQLKMEEYRKNLEIIFQNSTDIFILLNPQGEILMFNRAFEAYLREFAGVLPKVGMDFLAVLAPNREEEVKKTIQRNLKGEKITDIVQAMWPAGYKYFMVIYTPVITDNKVTHITVTATDITDKKKQDDALKEYRENLEIIFQNSIDLFLLLNPSAEVILFNKQFEKYIKDYPKVNAGRGTSFFDLVAPNRVEATKQIIARVLNGERVNVISESVFQHETKYYDVIYTPVITAGKVTHISVTSTDITGKRIQEEELRKYRENLEIIFKNSSDYFQLMDANGRLVLFNQKYEDLVYDVAGVKPKIGMPFGLSLDPETLEDHKIMFARVLRGETMHREVKVSTSTGEKYFEMRCSPVINNNLVTHVSVSSTDITERKKIEERRKQVEAELKKDEYFMERASESANLGYWTSELDPVNGKLVWSDEVFRIFQVDEKEFDGRNQTFFDFVHPDDRDLVSQAARLAIEQDQLYNVDHRIVLHDGRVRWVNERGNVIRSEADGSLLLVGIVQDINDRKLIEQVLREYNDRHEIVSKATNDAIWDWDIVNDKTIWNHGIESIFGYNEKDVSHDRQWWVDRLHPEDRKRVSEEIRQAFDSKLVHWTSEYRYHCSDGQYKHVLDRAYIIYDRQKAVRMIGAMQDISEITEYRINLEQIIEERTDKLNQALLKEKELVDLKSKFISIASHEFRTPLTTIRLAASFLKRYKNKLDPKQLDERASVIEKEVSHMTMLVEDVLFVGKMEEGKVKPNLKEHPLSIFEKLAYEAMQATDGTHSLEIRISRKDRLFWSDEKLLRNIVFNLITNAVKFSPQAKKVTVQVRLQQSLLELIVKDEGIGIPPDELKNLFASFSRATNASSIEGTGLGLLIIKKAVELLKGTVNVWSELGSGTEFTITLPTP